MNAEEEIPEPEEMESVPGWESVAAEVNVLVGRFDRKILEDQDKRGLIQELYERVRVAERGQFLEYLGPFVYRIAMVIDRLDRFLAMATDPPKEEAESQTEFVESIRAEMLSLLRQHQVDFVPMSGPVDTEAHEVVGLHDGEGVTLESSLVIHRAVRRGYRYGERVIRPAQVIATHRSDPAEARG